MITERLDPIYSYVIIWIPTHANKTTSGKWGASKNTAEDAEICL